MNNGHPEEDSDDASHTSITVIPETSDEENEDEGAEGASQESDLSLSQLQPVITHSIMHWLHQENHYQETLCRATQCMAKKEDIPCILEAELSNPVDAKAIAFKCRVDESWKTIGYAVREILDDLHAALEYKVIIDVKFEWIKLIFRWRVPRISFKIHTSFSVKSLPTISLKTQKKKKKKTFYNICS